MYCEHCGSELKDDVLFCAQCGSKVAEPENVQSETAEESSSQQMLYEVESEKKVFKKSVNKKYIIATIVAVLVIVGCIICISVHTNNKNMAEYNELIAEADRYVEELDYDKAEAIYLQAIDIDPKEDVAYIKLADTHIVQEEYEEAVAILEKGQKMTEDNGIADKLNEVRAYSSYYEYLEAEVIPTVGLVVVDEYFRWGEEHGLLSAVIKDINTDNVPEMITLEYGNTQHTELKISCYTYDDDKIVLMDEYIDAEFNDESCFGNKYEIFMKEHNEESYLVITGYQAVDFSWQINFMRIYSLSGEKVAKSCWVAGSNSLEDGSYWVDGNQISSYDNFTDDGEYLEEGAKAVADNSLKVFEHKLRRFGLNSKVMLSEYNTIGFIGYEDNAPSEINISYIQTGRFDEDNAVVFEDYEMRFLKDYTALRNSINH